MSIEDKIVIGEKWSTIGSSLTPGLHFDETKQKPKPQLQSTTTTTLPPNPQ